MAAALNSLISVFILGLIHGLTPDEHTWPVIFAYSVRQKKLKKAIKIAIFFALAATIPWITIAAIFGYLGSVFYNAIWEFYFQIILGAAMIILGVSTLINHHIPHFHIGHKKGHKDKLPKPFNLKTISLYGLILGVGPCAPVLLMYGFAAESKNLGIGILSGICFGLATLITLVILAGIFGGVSQLTQARSRKNLAYALSWCSGAVLIIFGLYLIFKTF